MLFIISLLPATIFAVLGFFVIFASTRSEGAIKHFGQYLGSWVLFLAGVVVVGGLVGSLFGMGGQMSGLMEGMTRHMETMSALETQQSQLIRELKRD